MDQEPAKQGYSIPLDEDTQLEETKVPQKKPSPPQRNGGFDATGGTSGIDMDNMVSQVREEDRKFQQEDSDENAIEDNYAEDQFDQYAQDQSPGELLESN